MYTHYSSKAGECSANNMADEKNRRFKNMKLTGRTGTVQSSPPHHTVYDSSDSEDDGRKILPTAPGRISMWARKGSVVRRRP